jgi:hypothetical protein
MDELLDGYWLLTEWAHICDLAGDLERFDCTLHSANKPMRVDVLG